MINDEANPFDPIDRQNYRLQQIERQVSDIYEKMSQLATCFEMVVKCMNGKELERIPAATGNVGLPAGDKAEG